MKSGIFESGPSTGGSGHLFRLHSLQHRGQEGAGILTNDHGKLKRHRDLGLLAEVFKPSRFGHT